MATEHIDRQDTKTFLKLERTAEDSMIARLNPLLADSIFIQSLYKKYHWHVEGKDFYQFHLLFDKHAGEHIPVIDLVAERIRTLGGKAFGMPDEVVAHATVKEPRTVGSDALEMVRNLCEVHEGIIGELREVIAVADEAQDEGTSDMLVSDVLRLHELQLWFLRSSL